MTRVILFLVAILSLGTVAQAGHLVVPAEQRYSSYSAKLPGCEDAGVLNLVKDRFAGKEIDYWNSSLAINSYDKIREIGFRANGLDYIPRRYCIARALLNDQRLHTVIYQIQEDLGFIGWGVGVEWCVVGLDRNFADAPACSALRPFAQRFLGEKVLIERY